MSEDSANLIANSSFGTEEVQALGARTSDETVEAIVARVEAAIKKRGDEGS